MKLCMNKLIKNRVREKRKPLTKSLEVIPLQNSSWAAELLDFEREMHLKMLADI